MAMSNKASQILSAYIEEKCGAPLAVLAPRPVTGHQVAEALWALNEHFRPNFAQISVVRYGDRFASSADKAIERFVATGRWGTVSLEAWRVLLERQVQAIILMTMSGHKTVMPVPGRLADSDLLVPAMLFWLHGMKLPFPVTDRAAMRLPESN